MRFHLWRAANRRATLADVSKLSRLSLCTIWHCHSSLKQLAMPGCCLPLTLVVGSRLDRELDIGNSSIVRNASY